jgi:hypothetical protein
LAGGFFSRSALDGLHGADQALALAPGRLPSIARHFSRERESSSA